MERIKLGAVMALVMASVPAWAAGPSPEDCQKMRLHGQRSEANKCFEKLSESSDAYLRAEGFWGLGEYDEANKAFRDAAQANDASALIRVRWGRLFHERFNDKDAADLFHEALQRDPKNAAGYLGQAIISVDGQDNQAAKGELAKALELDPKLYEAHELLAEIALEDSDDATALTEADKAIAISTDALKGYAVHAAAEMVVDRSPDAWIAKITAVNPGYGEGYALIAHDLELHYRYEDAIAYYRKAIEADPTLWSARSELGVNLMRIGQEDEAMKQLAMSYNNGETDALTSNSLKLLESNKSFVTFKDETTVLKFRKKEADLLQPYFSTELHRILTTYDAKYKMKLPAPVEVEVYPDHEDFAVRTMGMPGLGALGVTFGEVIAMDSPSGRKPGDFNWGSTLWHEMSHVYILTATHHRVPRWFTEGLAVHEEGARNPEWSNRVTPEVLMAIRDKKLLPVAKLDRGFTSPEYPSQVIVSYFQAGAICDFIATKWGEDKLLGMVHSYTVKTPTPAAIQENLGISADEFDTQFFASIDKAYGQEAKSFDTWRGILKGLVDLEKQSAWTLMVPQAQAAIKMYPEYVGDASAYTFLSMAQSELGDKKAAAATLMSYVKMGGEAPLWLKTLAAHEEKELGDKKAAAEVLARLNYIYPMDEAVHRHLGDLLYEQADYTGAVREYAAVVALNPLDKAGAQYNLARAYFGAGQKDKAETAVLGALETAPGFKPAQELLLQLNGDAGSEKKETTTH
jgi:tetratricopeptide (TPR) repeat protein